MPESDQVPRNETVGRDLWNDFGHLHILLGVLLKCLAEFSSRSTPGALFCQAALPAAVQQAPALCLLGVQQPPVLLHVLVEVQQALALCLLGGQLPVLLCVRVEVQQARALCFCPSDSLAQAVPGH